jgi:hypothetical protein
MVPADDVPARNTTMVLNNAAGATAADDTAAVSR